MKLIVVSIFFMVGLIMKFTVLSAQISGPSSAPVGSTQIYSYSNGFVFSPNWRLDQLRGTILSQTQSGTTYSATIRWNSVGSEVVAFFDGQMPLGQLNITITEPAPAAPVPVTPSNSTTSTTTFIASWSTVPTATSYQLDVSSSSNFSSFVPGYSNRFVSTNSHTVTGLAGNTTYYFRVRAVNSGGPSPNSTVSSIKTAPIAPTSIAVTNVTSSSFTATWAPSWGSSGYQVQVATVLDFSETLFTVPVSTESALITGLSGNVDYFFRVKAVNGTLQSGFSNIMNVTTLPAPPGISYSNVTATSFMASWTLITGATHYQLQVSTNMNFTIVVSDVTIAGSNSSTVTGLSGGTIYYARVRAYNSGWTTGFSAPATVLTVPHPPNANSVTLITATSFKATWDPSPGATTYRLDVSTNSAFSTYVAGHQNLEVSGSLLLITGLASNTQYFYRVRGVNASGPSANSNSMSVRTYTSPPVALAATNITINGFTANWSAVSGATSYLLEVSLSNTFNPMLPAYNNITINGISRGILASPNTVYYYRIRAVNATGPSAASNIITVQTLPPAPQALPSTALTSNSFTANWTAIPGITNFLLDVSASSAFADFIAGYNALSVTGTSRVISGLIAQKTYYYRLRAVNSTGASLCSNTIVGASLDKNFTKVTQVSKAGIVTQTQINALGIFDRIISYDYFDGLGRPMQKIQMQGSASGFDIVHPFAYDEYGREKFRYLPYATTEVNGFYKPNATGTTVYTGSPHQIYYSNGTADKVVDDAKPFSESVYIPSPTNQILEQGSPGVPWQPDAINSYSSSDRTIKFALETNVGAEVLRWTYTYPTTTYSLGLVNAGSAGAPVYYNVNTLFKSRSKDENHNEVIEYKDKEGKTVLKKVQAPAGQWAQTYYIHDAFGNLVCVLPPEAVARLTTEFYQSGATDATKDAFLKRWAFRYSYDANKRMTHKQVPGAEPVYMIYDKRDRLVLTQDGKQRSQATRYWTFTKYDEFNRPILTGIKDTTAALTQAAMQGVVNTFYTKPWTRLFEVYVGAITGNVHGYTNKSYPVVTAAATVDVNQYLNATYYDKYDFRSAWQGNFSYVNDALSQTVNGVTFVQPSENMNVTGQVTGTKTKVLDGGVAGGYTWLKTATYYDEQMRTIQSQSDNYKGGRERVSNLYDFTGKILKTKSTHTEADVTWKDIVGAKQEGNKLFKTAAGAAWGVAGAASVQKLPAGQNGWLEVVTSETTTPRMIGLSDINTDANYTTIDFAWCQSAGAALYIYENGTSRGQFGTYSPGDVLKIDRAGTTIRYYRNGVLLYTSPVASSSALMADAALHTQGATITNVRASFSSVSKTVTRQFQYDHAGRLIKSWHQLDALPEILMSYNIYNELGQLVDKKLHSTLANGADARQSVDYRYNIRGWLSSINNAELAVNATNDEAGDYFGMNLAYHDDLLTGNFSSLQYNGNISAIKWSVNQGFGTIKSMAYNYSYDPMNRLTGAVHKQATTPGSWLPGQFDEAGFAYDLNGNIRNLQRKGDGAILIDNLVYNYGTGASASNKLLFVQDNATDASGKWKGFYDGNAGTSTDFSYDANGNMLTDLNKGISTAIAYNFLNLPEMVTKGGNTVRYIYDASGRKLAQVTTFGATVKQTDYAGEFIYENDDLQFINHEEGRIVVASEQLIYTEPCENLSNKTPLNVALAAVTVNGEKYVRATSNGAIVRSGVFPIGGTFPVVEGQRYRIRAKGYSTGANPVHLLIKANGTDLNWPAGSMANSSNTESWMEQTVTIPAGATTLQAGVVWNTVTAGQIFHLNEFSIEKLSIGSAEYQYHLKDHLGNVRVAFTTKDETHQYTASLEDNNLNVEQSTFRNYTRVTNDLFDHTDAGTTYNKAHLLNGGNNSQVGLTKSFAVMPGDVVTAQVFAKHYGATGSSGNLAGFATALLSAFGLTPPVAGEVGTASAAIQNYGSFIAGGGNPGNTSWPKGFLNILVFDKNYTLIDIAYHQLEAGYVQPVGSSTKAPHQLLSRTKTIKEPGYVYIYLSNEGAAQKDIYFDDLSISHTKSKVIEANDYYPFGLTFGSYKRENVVTNSNNYNSKELQDELNLGWLDYGARMYDPSTARWNAIDQYSSAYEQLSPYSYVANNPVISVDYDGKLIVYVNGFRPSAYAVYSAFKFVTRGLIPLLAPHDHRVNWFDDDRFNYWDGFDRSWSFPAEEKFYVDGSNHAFSSAMDRFKKGEIEGKILADKIKNCEIELKNGETVKLIGHSMGAAHAMGIARGLIDAGIDPELVQVLLFAAHQSDEIPSVNVNFLLQVYRDSDLVTNKGVIAFLTNSKNERIGNNSDYAHLPDGNKDGIGNHFIQYYSADEFAKAHPKLYQYLIDKNIVNPDGTLVE